jgi:hypothetical protein
MVSYAGILSRLQEADLRTKPAGADQEWSQLAAYYDDQSRSQTRRALEDLGMGLAANQLPIDVGPLLRQVVDRAATIYRRAPSRFLSRAGQRLDEDSAEHELLEELLQRAQYDVAWRRIDRRRTLLGQDIVRLYPSDIRRSVVLRSFAPHQVMRMVSPTGGDLLDEDQALALMLAGDLWELWYRHVDDGAWCCVWVDRDGGLHGEQPFAAEPDFRSPYSVLPIQQVYVDYPGGQPWLPPSQSRQAYVRGVSAVVNDLMALVAYQAHSTRVYMRRDPNNRLPEATGPGIVYTIDADEDVRDIAPSPAITQVAGVAELLLRLFSTSEYLPANEFDPSKSLVTGAAYRVQLQPLQDRREDQISLVVPDERAMLGRLVAVHNVHAASWGMPQFPVDVELQLEVPDMEAPTTETEAGNLAARQLAIGTASVIDLIQREAACTRGEAIARYERIRRDLELYPSRLAATPAAAAQVTGARPAGERRPPDEAPDAVTDGEDSVISAITAGT